VSLAEINEAQEVWQLYWNTLRAKDIAYPGRNVIGPCVNGSQLTIVSAA
jgi:malate synthase